MEDVYLKVVMQDRSVIYVHGLYKKWNGSQYISSNVNEVIRAVLNFFITFFTKIFHTHKKAQNAYKPTKIKKAVFYGLKKHLREKSCLFTYFNFCAFFSLFLVVSLCFLCFCLVAYLYFLCFLCVWNLFLKKIIKRFETALMTSFTLLLN